MRRWGLFRLWYRVRLFCCNYWAILISAYKGRLTFPSQFSCAPWGRSEQASSCLVLSCQLGLNHNTCKDRVGNDYWFSYTKIPYLANFKCLCLSICCLVWLMHIIIVGLERNLRASLRQWTPDIHCVQSPHCVLLEVPALIHVQSFECHSRDENILGFECTWLFWEAFWDKSLGWM